MIFWIKHIFTFFFIKVPLQLSGIPILAITLLFYINDERWDGDELIDQRLPKFLRWFDVGDEIDKKYGLNGDLGYKVLFFGGFRVVEKPWDIYRLRFTWLALRNPINYFQHNVLGIKSNTLVASGTETDIPYGILDHRDASPNVGDYPGQTFGTRHTTAILNNGRIIREYYKIWLWPFNSDKCIRIRIGYKLGDDPLNQPRDTIQWCFVIQPWKTYLGMKV